MIKTTLFRDLEEAIAGSKQDFTSGSLRRAIFLLAVPMVLEMAMESVFAVVDIYYVSSLGADAVAAVGITESLITLVYAMGIGFSLATTAMIARRMGEKNPQQAARVAFQSIVTGAAISLFIAVPGALYATRLLQLMGANGLVQSMSGYTAVMLGGNVVIMLLFIINAIFRSAGDAAMSMRVLWIANILNLILDPLLIFGYGPFPELGVTGAAVATTIGRGLAVLYQFYLLFSGKARIKLTLRDIRIHIQTVKQLVRLALGGIGQQLIATSSWIGLMRIMSEFGSTVVAGYTIAIRIIIFVLLPTWGISNAAATLVGQNLGAKKPDRAEASVWVTAKVNIVFMGVISIILIGLPRFFIQLFIDDIEVINSGTMALRLLSIGLVAYGMGMVFVQAFNGAGDTNTPTKINLVCFWIFEIPLAYTLAILLGLREHGVLYSILASDILMTTIALVIFKRGTWKLKEV
jgi:putative MATE family efflux protein